MRTEAQQVFYRLQDRRRAAERTAKTARLRDHRIRAAERARILAYVVELVRPHLTKRIR